MSVLPIYNLRISVQRFSKTFNSRNQTLFLSSQVAFCSSDQRSSTLTPNKVLQFISSLNNEERKILLSAVKTIEKDANAYKLPLEDESIPRPTRRQLIGIGLYNAVPFIGFGFLDNTFMILGGDTIELMLGSMITISTMAAAALGNTMADILGIGSAYYVEKVASKLGFQQPQQVTQAQLNLNCSRVAANLGRTIGVTVGCILGMFPLLLK